MTANTGSFPYNMTRDPSALSALAAVATAWDVVQWERMRAAVPTLTACHFERLGQKSGGASMTYPAGITLLTTEGGGLSIASANNLSGRVTNNIKTSAWAIVARMACEALPASGRVTALSLKNPADDHHVSFGSIYDSSTTMFSFECWDKSAPTRQASTVTADTGYHDIMVTMYGGSLKGWVDGVLAATITDLTHIPATAGDLYAKVLTDDMFATHAMFGYVAP